MKIVLDSSPDEEGFRETLFPMIFNDTSHMIRFMISFLATRIGKNCKHLLKSLQLHFGHSSCILNK
jgi:hypothetical protein